MDMIKQIEAGVRDIADDAADFSAAINDAAEAMYLAMYQHLVGSYGHTGQTDLVEMRRICVETVKTTAANLLADEGRRIYTKGGGHVVMGRRLMAEMLRELTRRQTDSIVGTALMRQKSRAANFTRGEPTDYSGASEALLEINRRELRS